MAGRKGEGRQRRGQGEGAGRWAGYADTPCLYRIKNERRVRFVKDIIAMAMESVGAERNEKYAPEDADLPYKDTEVLIEEGLIKVIYKAPRQTVSREAAEEAATEIPENGDGGEVPAEAPPAEEPADGPAAEEKEQST